MREFHVGEFVAGAIFTIIGLVLLLDAVDAVEISITLLWPALLIGAGVSMLLSWALGRPES